MLALGFGVAVSPAMLALGVGVTTGVGVTAGVGVTSVVGVGVTTGVGVGVTTGVGVTSGVGVAQFSGVRLNRKLLAFAAGTDPSPQFAISRTNRSTVGLLAVNDPLNW